MEKNKTNKEIIGKVRNYNGFTGEIISEKGLYYFTKNDINGEIKPLDIVKFKGKTEEVFPQAYYVEKIS